MFFSLLYVPTRLVQHVAVYSRFMLRVRKMTMCPMRFPYSICSRCCVCLVPVHEFFSVRERELGVSRGVYYHPSSRICRSRSRGAPSLRCNTQVYNTCVPPGTLQSACMYVHRSCTFSYVYKVLLAGTATSKSGYSIFLSSFSLALFINVSSTVHVCTLSSLNLSKTENSELL